MAEEKKMAVGIAEEENKGGGRGEGRSTLDQGEHFAISKPRTSSNQDWKPEKAMADRGEEYTA